MHRVCARRQQEMKRQQQHSGVICNSCDLVITGFRYKCVLCVDYDLCSSCQLEGAHKSHCMLRIPPHLDTPEPTLSPLSKSSPVSNFSPLGSTITCSCEPSIAYNSLSTFSSNIPNISRIIRTASYMTSKNQTAQTNMIIRGPYESSPYETSAHSLNPIVKRTLAAKHFNETTQTLLQSLHSFDLRNIPFNNNKSFLNIAKDFENNFLKIVPVLSSQSDNLLCRKLNHSRSKIPTIDSSCTSPTQMHEKLSQPNDYVRANISKMRKISITDYLPCINLSEDPAKKSISDNSFLLDNSPLPEELRFESKLLKKSSSKAKREEIKLRNRLHHAILFQFKAYWVPKSQTKETKNLMSSYHTLTVPHIATAISRVLSMGFKDDDGYITQLVEAKDGDIGSVLNVLAPQK